MATKYWQGGAGAVAQILRITFSAYTSGQTYTLTVSNQSVSFLATASTEDNVVDGLVAAISAAGLAEFSDFTASNETDAGITLTGTAGNGVPFDMTGSATGGITATKVVVQNASGPNHYNNADNWQPSGVPVGGDDLIFADTSVELLYGLAVEEAVASVTILASFTGRIGLPSTNSTGYQEYRQRFWIIGDGAPMAMTIGQGSGSQSQLLLIDVNDSTLTYNQYGSGNAIDGERAVVVKNAENASTFNVFGGQFELAADAAGTVASLQVIPGGFTEADVLVDASVAAGAVTINGGQLELRGNATSLVASDGAQVTVTNASAVPTVEVSSGATIFWQSTAGIGTQLNVYSNGTIDFSRSGNTKTVAAASLFSGGTLIDSLDVVTWTAGIALQGATLEDVTLNLGRGKTINVS